MRVAILRLLNVIILPFAEDLEYREVAETVGKNQPVGCVIQHRALNALR